MKYRQLAFLLIPYLCLHGDESIWDLKKTLQEDEVVLQELQEQSLENQASKQAQIDELFRECAQQQSRIDELKTLAANEEKTKRQKVQTAAKKIVEYRRTVDRRWAYVTGEFLYWHTLEGSSDYAVTGQPFNDTNETAAIGDFKTGDFSWDPGFRIALGTEFEPNHWGVELQFTYLKNDGDRSVDGPGNTSSPMLVPTFFQDITTNGVSTKRATSDIELHYQIFDLLLYKRILFHRSLVLTFFQGFSAGLIDQDWNIRYKSTANEIKVDLDWDFQGVGLKAGFSSDWHIARGFGLFTQVAFTGLVGSYDNTFNQLSWAITPSSSTPSIIRNSDFNDTRLAYSFQILLGANWGKIYENWGVNLFLGYEMNPWFNLHEINRSAVESGGFDGRDTKLSRGLLCLQGINANLSFMF